MPRPARSARRARQIGWVGDVDDRGVDAELVAQHAAHQLLRHQAVLARVTAGGDDDGELGIRLVDGHVVAVRLERRGEGDRPLRVVHFFSPTGTDVPDHSPKIRTTIEMAAFLAPATMIGIDCGPLRIGWNSSSARGGPSSWPAPAAPGGPNRREVTSALPARRNSPTVRPDRSSSQFCTSALDRPAEANICACSGQSTSATALLGKICEPIREIVSWKSRSTSSGLGACRLSTNSIVRVRVADTALTPPPAPPSAASGSHGGSSSFSAMQIDQRPGTPWVACSNTCGWMPKALRTMRPIARGIVMFGRKPGPNAPPAVLKPSCCLIGPLTTISGAGPLVDWKPPPRAARSRISASNAASTTGKYAGLQPAIAALTAARYTVQSLPTCSREPMISSGSLSVVARNWSTSGLEAGTSGSP